MVLVDGLGPDIERINTPTKTKHNFFWGVIKDIVLVIFFSFCVFIFINFPAIILIGTYKLFPEKLAFEFKRPVEEGEKDTQKVISAPAVEQYPDNSIFIPKIGVKAPIGWDTENDNIMDALEENVIHLKDTDKPGGKGNIFLTGHSSNYWWKTGDYNTVFALLPELEEKDEIIITYNGKFYYYRVTSKEELKKDEVADHLESDKPKLTIMTCVPVGTNLKRLLIYAEPEKKE
ncbi:MAG: sortase [bacterium]